MQATARRELTSRKSGQAHQLSLHLLPASTGPLSARNPPRSLGIASLDRACACCRVWTLSCRMKRNGLLATRSTVSRFPSLPIRAHHTVLADRPTSRPSRPPVTVDLYPLIDKHSPLPPPDDGHDLVVLRELELKLTTFGREARVPMDRRRRPLLP